jgi:excisionase family DNA binding protein
MSAHEPVKSLEPLVYTVAETAEVLKISPQVVYRLIKAGDLRAVKLLGRTVIPKAVVNELLGIRDDHRVTPDELVRSFAKAIGVDLDDKTAANITPIARIEG